MNLLESFYQSCDLERELQEEVRKVIAYQIGCAYCMSHGCPTTIITNIKTKIATDFAKKVTQTQQKITEEDIESLKTHFSEKQISELCAFICYGSGLARFGNILSVDVSI